MQIHSLVHDLFYLKKPSSFFLFSFSIQYESLPYNMGFYLTICRENNSKDLALKVRVDVSVTCARVI